MQEFIKDYWAAIVGVIGLASVYGRNEQKLRRLQRDMEQHLEWCGTTNYITIPQHDQLQEVCRNEWRGEFQHIRDSQEKQHANIVEALREIKADIRQLREKQ